MREDGPPTLPSIPLASTDGEDPGRTPTWPIDRGYSHPSSTNYLMPLILGASLILNAVLLIGLLSILVFGRSSLFSQGGAPSGSPSAASPGSTAGARLSSPTTASNPTPTSASSPTVSADWLQVTPTSVQLGCNGNQQTQFVVLANTGPEPVQWQVTFSLPANQAGVNVGPNQGVLNPGSNMPIQIQNQTHANGPQGIPSQQGTITFNSATPQAGSPPTVMYTTKGCQ
jgi:hypothetical protein